MKAIALLAPILASAVGLSGVAHAAPAAKGWSSSLTDPTSTTAATIQITRSGKVSIKPGKGAVNFSLKLSGVADKVTGNPDSSNGNTLSVQFLVAGVTHNKDFTFNIIAGKVDPTTRKFPVANSDMATWGSALATGTPIEIRRVRVIQNATGEDFGVDGITTR